MQFVYKSDQQDSVSNQLDTRSPVTQNPCTPKQLILCRLSQAGDILHEHVLKSIIQDKLSI